MITVGKQNETFLMISCERHIAQELNEFFSFQVPGFQFMPQYRNKIWDGKIRLFNIKTQQLYMGLYDHLMKFAMQRHYPVKSDVVSITATSGLSEENINDFFKSLNLHCKQKPIIPRDYQVKSFTHCVKKERALLLSPTSSGKSLVIYALIRWHQHFLDEGQGEKHDKMLILVPTTNLVTQMYNDFKDYSSHDKWDVEQQCHMIYSGRDKKTDKQIVISTWQSLFRLGVPFFKQFGMVVGDEAHLCSATSLKGILEKMVSCRYRFGTTGTLTESKTHQFVLEGLFGQVYKAVTSKQLMKDKHISELKIQCLLMQYPEAERDSQKKSTYKEEIDFLVAHTKRNNFICNLALDQKGNTLILFNYVEKHGKVLMRMLLNKVSTRRIFFIAGETEVEQREEIRQATEGEDDAIIIASSGVLSTGVNIKNLQSLIFAHPYKAKIRNLQSIGRILRLDDKNNQAVLYDIVDDLHWKKRDNYGLKHWRERVKIYADEKFDYNFQQVTI
jgi:superfamily II DNA or RNA helicase